MIAENKIIYNHLDLLTNEEQEKTKKVFESKFGKLRTFIKTDLNLVVTLKIKEKQGPKKQYFFHLRTEAATKEFAITPRESDLNILGEWDITKAATRSMNQLIEIVKHRYDRITEKTIVKKE